LLLAAPLAKHVGLVAAVSTATEIVAVLRSDTTLLIDRVAKGVMLERLARALRYSSPEAWADFVAHGGDVIPVVKELDEPWAKICEEQLIERMTTP
jgi:hypothetical protein